MIKPTIGRKVWFWKEPPRTPADQPEDATIVYVWNDRLVNLFVVDHNGTPRSETSVTLRSDDDEETQAIYRVAVWMPYQIGQAKKESAG